MARSAKIEAEIAVLHLAAAMGLRFRSYVLTAHEIAHLTHRHDGTPMHYHDTAIDPATGEVYREVPDALSIESVGNGGYRIVRSELALAWMQGERASVFADPTGGHWRIALADRDIRGGAALKPREIVAFCADAVAVLGELHRGEHTGASNGRRIAEHFATMREEHGGALSFADFTAAYEQAIGPRDRDTSAWKLPSADDSAAWSAIYLAAAAHLRAARTADTARAS